MTTAIKTVKLFYFFVGQITLDFDF